MCMMTIRYADEYGGETVMENVASLAMQTDGLIVDGLLDGRKTLESVRIISIDFARSLTLIAPEVHP